MIRTFCFFLSSCSPPTLCRAPSSLWQITQLLQIDRDNDIIFVYIGGGRVPEHLREIITHARIDKSVREIDDEAFDMVVPACWMWRVTMGSKELERMHSISALY